MALFSTSPQPIGSSAYYGKYSYSGADVRAYGYFPGHGELISWLDSMHTISYSIHESKGDARSFGFRGVKGFTRGIRLIAGSLIMVVVQDNPFSPLMNQLQELGRPTPGWSFDRDINGVGRALNELDFTRRITTSLPPFNILLQLAGEVNNWQIFKEEKPFATEEANQQFGSNNISTKTVVDGAAVLLTGIDIVDEGTVVSVNDAYMEVSYTFKALDCKPISLQQFINNGIREPLAEQDPAALADIELAAELWRLENPGRAPGPLEIPDPFVRTSPIEATAILYPEPEPKE